jgi:hypothetical protein
VTEIVQRWGFSHLGRFAMLYCGRYGESPSATLRRRRSVAGDRTLLPSRRFAGDRPVVGVLPFGVREAAAMAEEIAAALCRKRRVAVGPPGSARDRLRGTIQADADGCLRAMVMLLDGAAARYSWADRWDGDLDDRFAFQERVAAGTASSIERSVREAEIGSARRKDAEQLNAWELAMRALPHALSIDAATQAQALELLERAMELAPADALPPALAACCHGQRGGHHFTTRPVTEKQAAREFAAERRVSMPAMPW